MRVLEPFFNNIDKNYSKLRDKLRLILQDETNLQEIVQLVGKESLSEDQKLSLETAKIIREDFLQQNAFTSYDYKCPLAKTCGMLKAIITFYERGLQAIQNTTSETRVTMETINLLLADEKVRIIDSKQDVSPEEEEEVIIAWFDKLAEDINTGFDTHFG